MRAILVIILLAAAAGPARAQLAPEYAYPGAPLDQLLTPSALTPHLLGDRPGPRARMGDGRDYAAVVTAPRTRTVARSLAAVYPASKRHGAERMFRRLLESYPRLEEVIGVPHGDLSGAAAILVIAAYEAANDVAVESEAYVAVVEQLRASMVTSRPFRLTSPGLRRELYEQLAAVGLFLMAVRTDLRAHPDPAIAGALAEAARGYLARLLRVEAGQVRITRAGLSFGAAPRQPAAVASAAPPAARPSGPDRSAAARAAAHIETVGFYTRVSIGYGGMVLNTPTPIVLFRSGDALLDMANLSDPAGIESNKRTAPGDWTRWRRAGRDIERLDRGRWRKLEWTKRHGPLPRGFTLDRGYNSTSGLGSGTGPGSSNVIAWRKLTFDRSGRFSTAGGAGATAGGVATSSRGPSEGGRYEVAGYTLTLRFDDGRVVQRSLVADPKDPGVIWIDGTGYTSR